MTARFTGKNVLVTGGGTGIGQAIALAFAHENATVAVAGRSAEPLAKTVKLIQDSGGRAMAITADITARKTSQSLWPLPPPPTAASTSR